MNRTFPHYRLRGSHHEVGRQHGEALRSLIRAHLDLIYTQGARNSQLAPETARRWARAFGPVIGAAAPHFLEEIEGPAFPVNLDLVDADTTQRIMRAQIMQLVVPVLGLPAVSVPTGVADGLPTGVQITAGRFREDLCLEAAAAIEARAPMATPIDPSEEASARPGAVTKDIARRELSTP